MQHKSKKRVRARHETFNGRLKAFSALKQVFRHDLFKHKIFFQAIVAIVHIQLENGHPLFQVNYETRSNKPIVVDDTTNVQSEARSTVLF